MYSIYDYITPEVMNNIEQKIIKATIHLQQYFPLTSYTSKTWVLNERIYVQDIANIENQIKIMGELINSSQWITNKEWKDGQLITLSYQDFNRWLYDLDLCMAYPLLGEGPEIEYIFNQSYTNDKGIYAKSYTIAYSIKDLDNYKYYYRFNKEMNWTEDTNLSETTDILFIENCVLYSKIENMNGEIVTTNSLVVEGITSNEGESISAEYEIPYIPRFYKKIGEYNEYSNSTSAKAFLDYYETWRYKETCPYWIYVGYINTSGEQHGKLIATSNYENIKFVGRYDPNKTKQNVLSGIIKKVDGEVSYYFDRKSSTINYHEFMSSFYQNPLGFFDSYAEEGEAFETTPCYKIYSNFPYIIIDDDLDGYAINENSTVTAFVFGTGSSEDAQFINTLTYTTNTQQYKINTGMPVYRFDSDNKPVLWIANGSNGDTGSR